MAKTLTIFDQLIEAEAAEKKAIAARIALEEEIFEYVRSEKLLTKEEGQETIEELGFSITVNQPISYKIDEEKYRALPSILQSVHKIRIDLDKTSYNVFLKTASKSDIKQIQNCITSKPGKVSIKIKKN